MDWKMLVRYLTIALVILGLFGDISQACHTNDEADCSNETEKTQTTVEDDEEADPSEVNLLKDTWFGAFLLFLERLLERYPVIREILQMIFA
ncbi:MAG: hypothetical protein KAR64_08540 [Thermoplasmatales archaeon]|nr:hypothetical protein [Thermoplasmatales archaeon]